MVVIVVVVVAIGVWRRGVIVVEVCILAMEEGLFGVGGCAITVVELGG